MTRSHAVLSVVALAAAVSCSDALKPTPYVGNYSLRLVNGSPPPASLPALPEGCSLALSGGTLVLGDGSYELTLIEAYSCPDTPTSPAVRSIGGSLDGHGETFRLRDEAPGRAPGPTFDASVVVAGDYAILTLGPGTFGLAASVRLEFGPRRVDAALASHSQAGSASRHNTRVQLPGAA